MDENIAGVLAPVLGRMRGQLEGKVQTTVLEIRTKLQEILQKEIEVQRNGLLEGGNCQKLQAQMERVALSMEDLKKKRDGAIAFLEKANKKVQSVQKVIGTAQKVVIAAKVVVKVVRLLPIPQAVPPGIGIPMNLTIKAGDLLAFTDRVITGILKAIIALNIILKIIIKILQLLLKLLKSLDFIFKLLLDSMEMLKALCKGEVSDQDLEDAELLTPERTLLLTDLAQEGLVSVDINGDKVRNGELTSGMAVTGDCRGVEVGYKGVWTSNISYTGNKTRRETVLRIGEVYLCKTTHLSTTEGETGPPENSPYWERLCRKSEYPQEITTMCEMMREILRRRSHANNADIFPEQKFNNLYSRLENSNLPDSLKDVLRTTVDFPSTDPGPGTKNIRYYTSTKGVVYKLEIFKDELYLQLAPRHFVTAHTLDGFLALKGDTSFSSSTEILFEEIIFQIETQL